MSEQQEQYAIDRRASPTAIMPAMDIEDAIKRRDSIVKFVNGIMEEDRDYGTIPGTNKPTLLKPGAEKLTTFFGLSPRFEILEKDTDWSGGNHDGEPFFYFQYKCQLYRGDLLAGEGVGSCNSWEKKYRYRRGERTCPNCEQVGTIIKGKQEYGGGWLCWSKKGGCGTKWPDGTAEIEDQSVGDVPNPNPQDLVNTIDKMAQKRALIAATLIAVNASEFFTQDIEDMVLDAEYTRPLEAPRLRDFLRRKAADYASNGRTVNDKQRGLCMGMLNECFATEDSDDRRRSVLAYVFEVDSGTELTDGQVLALLDWLNVERDSGGAYQPDGTAITEAGFVVRARMEEIGQDALFPEEAA